MPRGTTWVFTPDRGGRRIPEAVQQRTIQRIQRYAAQHFAGRYTKLAIRFRGSSATSMPTPSRTCPGRTGPRGTGRKPANSIWSGFATHRPISAGCASSAATTVGASPSTPTATSATSCPCSPPGGFSARPKRPSTFPRDTSACRRLADHMAVNTGNGAPGATGVGEAVHGEGPHRQDRAGPIGTAGMQRKCSTGTKRKSVG
jgi:hypothetical protein